MNKTVNRFLLACDIIMPQIHVKQAKLTYSATMHVDHLQKKFKKLN